MKIQKLFVLLLFPAAFFVTSCAEDENTSCEETTWYEDADGDGLGNPAVSIRDCDQPDGFVDNNADQDDSGVVANPTNPNTGGNGNPGTNPASAISEVFGGNIDLENLFNYANQPVPNYINEDNTTNNPVTDAGATLGRVLFYDKKLSVDNTIACASCHKQQFAFGDNALASQGVAGTTGRHSMRLVNARFAEERRFFWDERANSLETQTTMPIQDHVEMGFSGQDGDPDLGDLIVKLQGIEYYQELFTFVYGDPEVTEMRMQNALAQFVRSIQSFDSKYDAGRSQVNNNGQPFPNFTQQENLGKTLFTSPPNQGGAGCAGCHRGAEFDIDRNSRNNGVVGVIGDPGAIDVDVTRSPSLRDLVKPDGLPNGPFMHNGSLPTLAAVINHYDNIDIVPGNNNLDNRLRGGGGPGGPGGGGNGQNLNLTQAEKDALVAFLRTLSGENIYTDARWSNPFQ